MVVFPPCKINLGLHVVRKRNDGFHELETCFYPVPWTDILEIITADQLSFESTGIPIPGDQDSNLCLKAYRLLQQDYAIPAVKIHLHKIIPMGAGLGGGSADGAYTLRALNQLFRLGIDHEKLLDYAARLGSDCAFFVQDQPMSGSGRGEILTPTSVSLKGKFLLIVKPPVHVSTAVAFGGIQPRIPSHDLTDILTSPLREWRDKLSNDFEVTVFKAHPSIGVIKDQLYQAGALYASMTGSGSSVFGIFGNKPVWPDVPGSIHWTGMMIQ